SPRGLPSVPTRRSSDLVGYAIKRPGTNCFMIPETFQYISELAEQAHALGMEVLVEIHSYYRDQLDIARRVDRVYDFAACNIELRSEEHTSELQSPYDLV